MSNKIKLTRAITEAQFDKGYWYVQEIKSFAKEIGIPQSSKLRKDELEALIKQYLRTKEVGKSQRKNIKKKGIKDSKIGLKLSLVVSHYTNNKETKSFIEKEAHKINPQLKRRSGARYRLNRWRDEQITKGKKITYRDLVNEYVRLCETIEPFEKIPHGRYINFLSDYMANHTDASRKGGIEAWNELKELEIPKDYLSWNKYKAKNNL